MKKSIIALLALTGLAFADPTPINEAVLDEVPVIPVGSPKVLVGFDEAEDTLPNGDGGENGKRVQQFEAPAAGFYGFQFAADGTFTWSPVPAIPANLDNDPANELGLFTFNDTTGVWTYDPDAASDGTPQTGTIPLSIDTWINTYLVGGTYTATGGTVTIPINQTAQGLPTSAQTPLVITGLGGEEITATPDPNNTGNTVAGDAFSELEFIGENTGANGGNPLPADGTETRGTQASFIMRTATTAGSKVTDQLDNGTRRANTWYIDPKYFSDTPRREREDHRYENYPSAFGANGSPLNGTVKFLGGTHTGNVATRVGSISSVVLDFTEVREQNGDVIINSAGDYKITGQPDIYGSFQVKRDSNVIADLGDIDATSATSSTSLLGANIAGSSAFKEFSVEAKNTVGRWFVTRANGSVKLENLTGNITVSGAPGPSEPEGTEGHFEFEKVSNLTTNSFSTGYGAINVSTGGGVAASDTYPLFGVFKGGLVEASVNGTGSFSSANYGVLNVRRTVGFENGNALDAGGNEITAPVANPVDLELPDVWSRFEIDAVYNRNGRTGAVVSCGEWARAKFDNCKFIQEHPSSTTTATMVWSHGGGGEVNDFVFVDCEFISDDPNTKFFNTQVTNVSRVWLINCRGNIPLDQIGGGRVIINGVSDVTGVGSHIIGTGATDVKPWEYTFDATLKK